MLTDKQWRIAELVSQGLKNREIAEIIGNTEDVTKNYLRAIYDKIGVWNRVELALWYESHKQERIPSPESKMVDVTNGGK